MKRDLLGLAATILVAVGAGCTTDPTETLSEGIGAVSTSVSYVEVVVGDSVAVTAETKDNQGVAIPDPLPTAASQDPTVISVTDAYLPPLAQARFYVKAVGYGEGEVAVTAGDQTATIVVQTFPASVEIGGAPATLLVGNSVQLTAVPLDAAGNTFTMDPALFTWAASPASRISVNATGLATGLAPGAATITVSGPGGVTATADVVVQ